MQRHQAVWKQSEFRAVRADDTLNKKQTLVSTKYVTERAKLYMTGAFLFCLHLYRINIHEALFREDFKNNFDPL